jgi:hypothetical protein
MKMNLCVNGEKDEGLASITKLVTAIHSSQNSTALLGSDEAEDT